MAHLCRNLHQHFSILVLVSLILLCTLPSPTTAATNINNPSVTEKSSVVRQALLSFKLQLSNDPLGALASWHNDSSNFCNWQGITCSKKHNDRVIALDLRSKGLVGQIPLSVANLSFLAAIDLSDNYLHSAIPDAIGGLKRLRKLNLSMNSLDGMIPAALASLSSLEEISLWNNSLTGEIPSNLSRCSSLKFIHFSSNKLQGRIPPWIGTLPALEVLILSGNNFVGNIPDSLGITPSLTYVNIGQNYLTGRIPHNITNSQYLQYLVLPYNSLSGRIPPELFNSSSLFMLDLTRNNFTGAIPPVNTVSSPLIALTLGDNSLSGNIPVSLANFSSISMLYLSDNNLVGSIPDSLGMLQELENFDLSINKLSGLVPHCIYNMSSLKFLSMGNNSLSGTLPWNIGLLLPSISTLILQANRFEGLIPASLVNVSSLEVLDLALNSFHGLIPSLGTLTMLKELDIGVNHLEEQDWSSLSSLTNCSNLVKLLLDDNKFKGSLPESIGNFTINMNWLWLSKNNFSGSIPSSIGNLKNLTLLYADQNQLTGSIPPTIGNLHKLGSLSLARNKLTGVIPNSIGNLDQVEELYLDNNELEGTIPSTFEGCKSLLILNLSSNSLDGNIPVEFFRLSSLSRGLDLSHNLFSGSIPLQVGNLINLGQLYLSGNLLSGKIPFSLGNCVLLQSLQLDRNSLDGGIPDTFSNLKGIEKMDLSQNQLSGPIPSFFESYTSLQYLNLSFNDFSGPVPTGSPVNSTAEVSLQGNKMLCAVTVIHGLPPCLTFNSRKVISYILKIALPLGVFSLLSLLCLLWLFFTKRRRQPQRVFISNKKLKKVGYADIFKGTNNFSPDNLVGMGRFGAVYKAVLDVAALPVAIKVFDLEQHGAVKSFCDECNVLKRIRHRNLITAITLCSTIDYSGKEFKALIFEYMPNGNLDKWIHLTIYESGERPLSLGQRINIAMDVAYAIDYLHNRCVPALVHCDLKPSNILLDYEMTAHVADFGLTKFLYTTPFVQHGSSSMSCGPNGSIGYIAPEYAMGIKNTTEGDVFSYGVLLLEMITGKRPTDEIFKDGLNLHKFVYAAFPGRVSEILDPNLLQELTNTGSDSEEQNRTEAWMHGCIIPLLKIGLLCCMEQPRQRMRMGDVCTEVAGIKDEYLMSLHPEEHNGY